MVLKVLRYFPPVAKTAVLGSVQVWQVSLDISTEYFLSQSRARPSYCLALSLTHTHTRSPPQHRNQTAWRRGGLRHSPVSSPEKSGSETEQWSRRGRGRTDGIFTCTYFNLHVWPLVHLIASQSARAGASKFTTGESRTLTAFLSHTQTNTNRYKVWVQSSGE